MRVLVVGAGVAGLSAAWHVRLAGHKVVVHEALQVGAGASGKALGMLMPYHNRMQGRMAKLQRESLIRWPTLAQQIAHAAGVEVGVFFRACEGGAQLNVPTVLEVWAKALREKGVEIVENTPVPNPLAMREVYDAVIVAAGLGNAAWLPIVANGAQAMRVRPQMPVSAPRFLGGGLYVAPDWDGHVRVGSHDFKAPAPSAPCPRITGEMLQQAQQSTPELADAVVVEAWVANRPASKPLLPLVRPLAAGVWGITGLGKLGYCLAPAVGEAVVGEIECSKFDVRVFDK